MKRSRLPLTVWTTTAIFAAMLSACGKSKNSASNEAPAAAKPTTSSPADSTKSPTPENPQAQTPAQVKSAANPTDSAKKEETAKNKSTDKSTTKSADKSPTKSTDKSTEKSADKNAKDKNSTDANKKKIQTPVLEKTQAQPEKSAKQNSPETQQALPSDANASDLLNSAKQFSGTANDALRGYLIFKQEQISDSAQQLANLQLASEIQKAHLKIDSSKKQVQVQMLLKNEEVVLNGNLRADRSAMLTGRSGKETVTAKMLCFDKRPDKQSDKTSAEAKCATNVISLSLGKARAQMILRTAAAQVEANFEDQKCSTAACQNFYLFFRFTEVDLINAKSSQQIEMETYEVIHGKTGFKVLAVTSGNNVFTFAGTLLKPDLAAQEKRAVDTTLETDDLKNSKGESRKTTWNQAMSDVRLLANDGKGQIQLLVELKTPANLPADHFRLKLNRKMLETRTVLDNGYDLSLN